MIRVFQLIIHLLAFFISSLTFDNSSKLRVCWNRFDLGLVNDLYVKAMQLSSNVVIIYIRNIKDCLSCII